MDTRGLSEHPAVALVQMRGRRNGGVSPLVASMALLAVAVLSTFGFECAAQALGWHLEIRPWLGAMVPNAAGILVLGFPAVVAGRYVAHLRCLRRPGALEDLLPTQVPPAQVVDPVVLQVTREVALLWVAAGCFLTFLSLFATGRLIDLAPLGLCAAVSVLLSVPLAYLFLALAGWGAGPGWLTRTLVALAAVLPPVWTWGLWFLFEHFGRSESCYTSSIVVGPVLTLLCITFFARLAAHWTLSAALAPRTRTAVARPVTSRAPENPILYRHSRAEARRSGRLVARYGLGAAVLVLAACQPLPREAWTLLVLGPLLIASPYRGLLRSMESMAEERERGTFEAFLTSGVTVREFIWGWTRVVLGPLLLELLLAGGVLSILAIRSWVRPGEVLAGVLMIAALTTCTTFMGMLSARRPESASASWRHREAMVVCAPIALFLWMPLLPGAAPMALLLAFCGLTFALAFLHQAWLALSRQRDTVSFRT